MPDAELHEDRVVITQVAYRDRDAIRELPGAHYRADDGTWTLPVSWLGVKVMRALFPDRMTIGPALAKWLWTEHTQRIATSTELHAKALDPSAGVDLPGVEMPDLYPYQTTGAAWLANTGDGAILADEMGTGKTAQAIAALELRAAYPALVVCPKSAKAGWVREFKRWAPHRDVVIVGGSALQRRKALAESHDVYVVHWDALRLHSRLAPYGSTRLTDEEKKPKELNGWWGAVVADEAHRATSPKAKQTRALWAIGDGAGFRVALTGTPIKNRPDELWSVLRFVSPREWPQKTKFIDRWCDTAFNRFGGLDVIGIRARNSVEFHELIDLRLLRRPERLVLPWLPEKVYERREVEMLPRQAKAYKQFKEDCLADLEGGLGVAIDPLSILTRLTQLASATLQINEDGDLRMCAPSSKVDALIDLLQDMGEDPLVVFAHSRQLINLAAEKLEKEKISFSMIVGGQRELERYEAERRFMDGEVRVILLTLGAGAEALTLTRASTTCFLQRSWSLVENRQAEDRTHRPGQEGEKVVIIDLVAPGTVEDDQRDAMFDKDARFDEVVQDRALLARLLTGMKKADL